MQETGVTLRVDHERMRLGLERGRLQVMFTFPHRDECVRVKSAFDVSTARRHVW